MVARPDDHPRLQSALQGARVSLPPRTLCGDSRWVLSASRGAECLPGRKWSMAAVHAARFPHAPVVPNAHTALGDVRCARRLVIPRRHGL